MELRQYWEGGVRGDVTCSKTEDFEVREGKMSKCHWMRGPIYHESSEASCDGETLDEEGCDGSRAVCVGHVCC